MLDDNQLRLAADADASARAHGGVTMDAAAVALMSSLYLEPASSSKPVRTADSCHACGKGGDKLLACGRCRSAWFCNRECQVVAIKEQGHKGANCLAPLPLMSAEEWRELSPSELKRRLRQQGVREIDGKEKEELVQLVLESNKRACLANLSTAHPEAAALRAKVEKLMAEAKAAKGDSSRTRTFAAVEKYKEAASVAALIGGAAGAFDLATTGYELTYCFLSLNDAAAAARAACSALREASASGSRSKLVESLLACGAVALKGAGEMAKAESESRTQGARYHGGLDLAQEAVVSLELGTGLLRLAYNTIAVTICDTALEAAGGRDSPAAADHRHVPSLSLEAQARGSLGLVLRALGGEEQQQWSAELQRQAVALLRRLVDEEKLHKTPGARGAKRTLAIELCNLGATLNGAGIGGAQDGPGSEGMAEAEACLREALELCGGFDDVGLRQVVLQNLVNMAGHPDQRVGPAESAGFRSRLNQCLRQQGRSPETSCSICIELLAPPADGAEDAARDGGRGADGYTLSSVRVLDCMHQFHRGCLLNWLRVKKPRGTPCPLCKT